MTAFLGQLLPGIALALAATTGLAFWWTKRRPTHATGCPGGTCTCTC